MWMEAARCCAQQTWSRCRCILGSRARQPPRARARRRLARRPGRQSGHGSASPAWWPERTSMARRPRSTSSRPRRGGGTSSWTAAPGRASSQRISRSSLPYPSATACASPACQHAQSSTVRWAHWWRSYRTRAAGRSTWTMALGKSSVVPTSRAALGRRCSDWHVPMASRARHPLVWRRRDTINRPKTARGCSNEAIKLFATCSSGCESYRICVCGWSHTETDHKD
mmetsp:Transcript_36951/g.105616  ORF Transcript_36951/g.105616 Transcript_36951/m.105616 type:complete len:226 (-) Transcript_36951:31-708(-)